MHVAARCAPPRPCSEPAPPRPAPLQAVLVHQLSKRASQNPFRKNKGQVQRVAFHPSKPFFFVATQNHVGARLLLGPLGPLPGRCLCSSNNCFLLLLCTHTLMPAA